jgi:hypothetical protein
MTYTKAIEILRAAARDAEEHRELAASVGDIPKNNKFREIRDGFIHASETLEAHRTAKPRRAGYDSALMSWAR